MTFHCVQEQPCGIWILWSCSPWSHKSLSSEGNDSPSGSCPSVPGRLWGGLMENAGVALDPQSRALSSEKINWWDRRASMWHLCDPWTGNPFPPTFLPPATANGWSMGSVTSGYWGCFMWMVGHIRKGQKKEGADQKQVTSDPVLHWPWCWVMLSKSLFSEVKTCGQMTDNTDTTAY